MLLWIKYLEPQSTRETRDDIRAQIIPPATPFMTVPEEEMLKLPEGVSSLDLLDREDRI